MLHPPLVGLDEPRIPSIQHDTENEGPKLSCSPSPVHEVNDCGVFVPGMFLNVFFYRCSFGAIARGVSRRECTGVVAVSAVGHILMFRIKIIN